MLPFTELAALVIQSLIIFQATFLASLGDFVPPKKGEIIRFVYPSFSVLNNFFVIFIAHKELLW